MKYFRLIGAYVILCIAILCWFTSCQKNSPPVKNINKTTLFNLYLGASSPAYRAVNIDIRQILVKASSDSNDNSGWIQIPLTRKGKYNLLRFTHGRDTLLGSAYLPSGSISQIRLILGDGNEFVMSDSTIISLELPSELQSGLKINLDANLLPGVPYNRVLDFNIARSIIQGGKLEPIFLDPSIRTKVKEERGSIEGMLLPDSAMAQVIAISATDTADTAPDQSGYYKFPEIPQGIYTLYFLPGHNINYKNDTLDSIRVYEGITTTVDTVVLEPLGH